MREAPRSESWGRSREDVKMVEESEPEEAKSRRPVRVRRRRQRRRGARKIQIQ
jgi:hypothetical protein